MGTRQYDINRIATIPNGTSQSQIVDLEDHKLVGIVIPAAWTAASLTFLVAPYFAGPLSPLHDALNAGVEVTVVAGRAYALELWSLLAPWRYLVVRSGTDAVPVNQAADRDIILVAR